MKAHNSVLLVLFEHLFHLANDGLLRDSILLLHIPVRYLRQVCFPEVCIKHLWGALIRGEEEEDILDVALFQSGVHLLNTQLLVHEPDS